MEESIYKDSFIEAKKGEQRGYWFSVVIAFICFGSALNASLTEVNIPFFGVSIPGGTGVYVLLIMYALAGCHVTFNTWKSDQSYQGMKKNKELVHSLRTYPSILNIGGWYRLIPLSIPVGLMSATFSYGTEHEMFVCLWAALVVSFPILALLVFSGKTGHNKNKLATQKDALN